LKIFRRLATQDADLTKVQNAIEQVINPLAKLPLLDGTPLTQIVLTTSALKVPHQLGRTPRGFFVTDLNANAVVFRTGSTDTTITLTASASCTVNLWVY
jgi:hypothetical protein